MPEEVCLGCGGVTNTAVCDWIEHRDMKPRKCYARFEDDRWIKGCGYESACSLDRHFVDGLLKKDPREEK